jgi:queuine tRNA-ribosyltransferase
MSGWQGPILTDSGGFQIFSLKSINHVSEQEATFRSHIDGAIVRLTPEHSIEIQEALGSDVAMVLDHVVALPASPDQVEDAMARSIRWARRCLDAAQREDQARFAIVQGGLDIELRVQCARELAAMDFDGYAVGGLSVGESPSEMYRVTAATCPTLPETKPRYLMGVGRPIDLLQSVARGIDLFDCVLPTRNARNGQLFTREGPIAIKNARFADDDRPPDSECGCPTCRRYSRAYLRHLFMAGEMSGAALNTLHNLHFYLDTMRSIRKAIVFGTFESFRTTFRETYSRRRSQQ